MVSSCQGADRYTEIHLRRIGSNVSAYVTFVMEALRNSIPKAVVHCQVGVRSQLGAVRCSAF